MKATKVILVQDVPNLGEEGDVKLVAPGYARNYLIPRGLALLWNRANVALIESRRHQIQKRKEEKRKKAMDLKTLLESEPITLVMPAGEKGKLFGSVTAAVIVEALQKKGIQIERKRVEVPGHGIKMVGTYKVPVHIYEDQRATLTVLVKAQGSESGEAAEQETSEASSEAVSTQAE